MPSSDLCAQALGLAVVKQGDLIQAGIPGKIARPRHIVVGFVEGGLVFVYQNRISLVLELALDKADLRTSNLPQPPVLGQRRVCHHTQVICLFSITQQPRLTLNF